MTKHRVASFTQAVGDHYGLLADLSPASTEHVAPFFAIILSALVVLGQVGAGFGMSR